MIMRLIICIIIMVGLDMPSTQAHILSPSLLTITKQSDHQYVGYMRVSGLSQKLINFDTVLMEDCAVQDKELSYTQDRAVLLSWLWQCDQQMLAPYIQGVGLKGTSQAVLLTYFSGERRIAKLLSAEDYQLSLGGDKAHIDDGFMVYILVGVDHIVSGYDHLSFVLCLVILSMAYMRQMLLVITCFTVAHSMTLALAVLTDLAISGTVVEALIALSIIMGAGEAIKSVKKREATKLANNIYPMVFIFGLLHGFGFAGYLKDMTLSPLNKASALFGFNLGVEIGQILFALAIAGIFIVARKIQIETNTQIASAGIAGSLGGYWFIDRVVSIV